MPQRHRLQYILGEWRVTSQYSLLVAKQGYNNFFVSIEMLYETLFYYKLFSARASIHILYLNKKSKWGTRHYCSVATCCLQSQLPPSWLCSHWQPFHSLPYVMQSIRISESADWQINIYKCRKQRECFRIDLCEMLWDGKRIKSEKSKRRSNALNV